MNTFLELRQLDKLLEHASAFGQVDKLAEVQCQKGLRFPVYGLILGTTDKSAPTFCIVAGVHGLEKVGTHLALHYLESFVHQLQWDDSLKERMHSCRLVSIPLLNPAGMYHFRRANPNGVDLMRNSPTESEIKTHFLLGGHRISHRLPWYRGPAGAPMEIENQALTEFIQREVFPSKMSMVLDLHSGFGAIDRIWHPYAKTNAPFPYYKIAQKFVELLNRTYPFHVYRIEGQSESYSLNGDMWDFLFDQHYAQAQGQNLFLPWTLEMGSWIWLKKNPLQIFSSLGPFNPVRPHRFRRTMRRHFPLIDLFLRATHQYRNWALPTKVATR